MELKTVSKPYDTYVRLKNTSWIFEMLHKDILSYEEIHVQILDRQVRKLRIKKVASVKILWTNQFIEEATWEAEEDMRRDIHISLRN